jgi:hypothetical protein
MNTHEDKTRWWRAIWREKMHVEATALELAPPTVRARFAHIWSPAEVWREEWAALPAGALRFWLAYPGGHVLFTHRPSAYLPGAQPWREGTLDGVCVVSLAEVGQAAGALPLLRLFDHLWGCGGAAEGAWLSAGGGVNKALAEVGARFIHIHALGYGHAALGVSTARDYFAHTLWLALREPHRLEVLDPLAYRLYRQTVLAEEFWKRLKQ